MRKEDMVSDADLRKQYGVDDEGAYRIVDESNGVSHSRYEGEQEKPSTTVSTGMGDGGAH